jgi:hypothetical protein
MMKKFTGRVRKSKGGGVTQYELLMAFPLQNDLSYLRRGRPLPLLV